MLKLLPTIIIEDEYLLLDDILNITDWEKLGFQITATAVNGRQGMEKILSLKPRVIITDIRMPYMSGLDMIKHCMQALPQLKAVILTAYGDFDYAKEALKFGVTEYILKSEITPALIEGLFTGLYEKIRLSDDIMVTSVKNTIEQRIISVFQNDAPAFSLTEKWAAYAPLPDIYYEELAAFSRDVLTEACTLHHIPVPAFPDHPGHASDHASLDLWLTGELDALHAQWKNIYSKGYSPAIRQSLEYIDRHFGNSELSINEIAEAVHFSVSRLCAVFKKETGQTINDYLTDRRMEEAKRLLRSGCKVYETSLLVGYSSSQYFSRVFQQRTGFTPTEYR